MSKNEAKARAAVERLTDQKRIARAQKEAPYRSVRLAAVRKLTDQAALREAAVNSTETDDRGTELRCEAIRRLEDTETLCALLDGSHSSGQIYQAAADALGEERLKKYVMERSDMPLPKHHALSYVLPLPGLEYALKSVRDQRFLAERFVHWSQFDGSLVLRQGYAARALTDMDAMSFAMANAKCNVRLIKERIRECCQQRGHDWGGCICIKCNARRDAAHDWDGWVCRHCKKRIYECENLSDNEKSLMEAMPLSNQELLIDAALKLKDYWKDMGSAGPSEKFREVRTRIVQGISDTAALCTAYRSWAANNSEALRVADMYRSLAVSGGETNARLEQIAKERLLQLCEHDVGALICLANKPYCLSEQEARLLAGTIRANNVLWGVKALSGCYSAWDALCTEAMVDDLITVMFGFHSEYARDAIYYLVELFHRGRFQDKIKPYDGQVIKPEVTGVAGEGEDAWAYHSEALVFRL